MNIDVPPLSSLRRQHLNLQLLVVGLAIACIPVFYDYCTRMMAQGHYQFFPLVIAVAAWWGWQKKDEIAIGTNLANRALLTLCILICVVLLGIASIFTSTFAGALALYFTNLTVVYWLTGRDGIRCLAPVFFLLLFIIPIPFRADAGLILRLQFLASQLASWILDSVGEMHFREGVILIGENRSFLTEEACSGIRSLFSSLAAMAIYGVVLEQRWWRIGLNLIQVVGWVIIGNGLRVAIVVYGVTHWTEQLGTGIAHEALGLVVFFFIVLMALSTDRLLQAILPGRRTAVNPEGPISGTDTFKSAEVVPLGINPTAEWIKPFGIYGLISMLLVIAFIGARRQIIRYADPNRSIVSSMRLPPPLESDMPVVFGAWSKTDFEIFNRGKESIMAEESHVWTYSNGKLTALVSLDSPYNSWHDLSLCYSGLGWQCSLTQHYGEQAKATNAEQILGYSELRLKRVSGENAQVLFSTLDRNGDEVSPPLEYGVVSQKALWEMAMLKFAAALGLSADSASELRGIPLPATAVQLYCAPQTELTEQDIASLTDLYREAREALRKSARFQSGK